MLWLFFGGLLCVASTQVEPPQLSKWMESAFANENVNSVLLMFHVNWCGACKRTLPAFLTLKDIPRSVSAHVDVTDHKSFSEELGITGYPDLRVVTRENQIFKIPYYSRDAHSIAEFVARINAPDWVDNGETLIRSATHSFVFFSQFEDISLPVSWKPKIQFLRVSDPAQISPNCESFCGKLVPNPSLVDEVVEKIFISGDLNEFFEKSIFSGIWNIHNSQQFQQFNDQTKFKVFLNHPVNCTGAIDLFSFAIIQDPELQQAMSAEFGSETFVLPNEPLSFAKFWSISGNLCSTLDLIASNQLWAQYRGNWIAKIHGKYADFLKINFGVSSEMGQIFPIFALLFAVLVFIMYCCSDSKQKQQ